jgi:tripartite-type tricarboxylate transporter receptor subunit TctC
MDFMRKQPADGLTIGMMSPSMSMVFAEDPRYGINDFKMVARVQSDPRILLMKSGDKRNNTWEDVLKYAKANPDKPLSLGGSVPKGADWTVSDNLKKKVGLNINYVPLGATGDAIAALIGGHVDLISADLNSFKEQLEAGNLKMVMSFSEKRLKPYPDVPTARELGYDIVVLMNRGVVVTADTPRAIIDELNNSIKKALETPSYKEFEKKAFLDLVDGYQGTDDYQKFINQEYEDWKVIFETEKK